MKKAYHKQIAYVLLAMAMACKSGGEKEHAEDQEAPTPGLITVSMEQFQRNDMRMENLRQEAFPEVLEVSGTVDVPPENRVVVSAIRGGFVREIKWIVGDQVAKGQRIALLESPEYLELQQAYLETQAELPALRAEYQRQKTLLEENISSEKVFLEAQSAFQIAQARNNSLIGQLKLLHIPLPASATETLSARSPVLAPISGSITRVSVRKGAFVSQAAEIVEIISRDHLHLELKVYEKDVGKLQIGQSIRFRIPELSQALYEAEIHLIGSSVDEDRSVQVHAHLADGMEEDLLVGMFVQAEVLLAEKDPGIRHWAVPEASVVRQGNTHYILVLDSETSEGYHFKKQEVRPGRTSAGVTELLGMEGADTGTKVLSTGAFSLIGS